METSKSTYKIRFKSLTDRQREIARDIIHGKEKYYTLKCGRQGGKSYLLERTAFALCITEKDLLCAIIMANEKQLKARFNSMITWLPKNLILSSNKAAGNREIIFINGTKLQFFTAGSPDSIAGNSFDYIFNDEFALWKKEQWYIIKPTVAAKKFAKVFSVSTPRGINQFYDLYQMGNSEKYPRYKSFDMSYTDNPYYDIEEVEEARLSFSDAYFRQEYLAEFIQGFGAVFGEFKEVQTVKEYDITKSKFFAIDVSGTGDDDTILYCLDEKGKTTFVYRCLETSMPLQAEELKEKLSQCPGITGYVECNGLGQALCDLLQSKGIQAIPYFTTNDSKQICVSMLIRDINSKEIELPTPSLCGDLDNQLCVYEATRTATGKLAYSHPKGGHDDYTDALMICNKARHELVNKQVTPRRLKYRSLNYHR